MTLAAWFASQSDPRRDPEIGREGRELMAEAKILDEGGTYVSKG